MLLTSPRSIDVFLGIMFLIINSIAFACSYYFILHQPDDPVLQHAYITLVCYGFIQSSIGFTAGVWLARITDITPTTKVETKDPERAVIEEEMLLMEEGDA
jgi:hypothetical protein